MSSSMSSRSRRSVSDSNPAMATVSRSPSSRSPQSMRLTVKTTSSKLREATRANASDDGDDGDGDSISVNTARDPFIGGKIIEGKRNRTVRKSYVLDSDSEDEEDEDEDEEMDDVADDDDEEDAEGEDDDEDMDAEDDGLGDEDAEGEEIDIDLPPPPVIKISKAQSGKQTATVKPPPSKGNLMSVEQKEMANGSDDEELSELDSVEDDEDEVEEEDEEVSMQMGNEEDAEGEDEDVEVVDEDEEEEEEEEDEEMDSDDETPAGGSRATTPDISKLTKRQRARLVEGGSGHLLALPDEVQVKKHLTAEEHAMRRAEMARRRKNLSEKRNEEEKMETINKLLKKQAPKTSSRRKEITNAGDVTPDTEPQKPNPLFVRWISNKDGNRICVPEEWLDKPVGSLFQNTVPAKSGMGGKLIEEVN
ncbi:PAPA-1-like conserved region-domain-containing protein [Xylogone sp. PMI_703]|nr:PAPA-1-like conserved region-domain-containing protein [Xylogone sp. PMI_703]